MMLFLFEEKKVEGHAVFPCKQTSQMQEILKRTAEFSGCVARELPWGPGALQTVKWNAGYC